ncbi:DUF401 family protein [Tissierellaceae bacterium HCP3S3_D8]
MDVIKLVIVFTLIILLIRKGKSLSTSIFIGALITSILYNIGIVETIRIAFMSITSWTTLSVILAFYMITFLQRMLENRGHLDLAQRSLNGIFNNRRINASLAPFFIGLLPSPGAIFISGEMVDKATKDYISIEDRTFITTFYRHIPESFLPTYSSIILATQLSGVPVANFIISMLPVVALLFILGYVFYLKKIPRDTGQELSPNKGEDIKNLIKSLWTIALAIILILAFDMSVYLATSIVIILSVIINKFKIVELRPMFISAFEPNIILNSIVVMFFKDIITHTGVITALPELFERLPIPTAAAFALIFFFGTIVSGSLAIIALCIPLAYIAIPDGGVSLMMLLMSFSYAAMQFSPTHICLTLVTEYFKTSMVDLLKRTAPVIGVFCVIVSGYYMLLQMIF